MTTKQQLTGVFAILVIVGVSVSAYIWWTFPRRKEKARSFKFVRTTGSGTDESTKNSLLAGQSLAVELVDYQE
nr:hypothetical protein [uncultured Arsenicibacter sp.]